MLNPHVEFLQCCTFSKLYSSIIDSAITAIDSKAQMQVDYICGVGWDASRLEGIQAVTEVYDIQHHHTT